MQPEGHVTTYADWAPTQFDPRGLGLPDRQDWLVCPIQRTRDSGPLDQSNFAVMLDILGGESDTVEVLSDREADCADECWGDYGADDMRAHLQAEHGVSEEQAESLAADQLWECHVNHAPMPYECDESGWCSFNFDYITHDHVVALLESVING